MDPSSDPFVGNETVDDNLTECVQIALWNALGDLHGSVFPKVNNGVVTLSGAVTSAKHRDAAEAAASSIAGVVKVIIKIDIVAGDDYPAAKRAAIRRQPAVSIRHIAPQPMVYVVRFCGVDEASMSAALRQGVHILDEFLASKGHPAGNQLFVVYRNQLPGTVTLQVGMPVDAVTARSATGELTSGTTPGGSFMTKRIEAGLPNLLTAEAELLQLAKRSRVSCQPWFWQSFPAPDFRPWLGHPRAPVHLPIEPSLTGRPKRQLKRVQE